MRSPFITDHPETAALYAVLLEDVDEASRIVGDMFPTERAELRKKISVLDTLLGPVCDRCGTLAPVGTTVSTGLVTSEYLCRDCVPARDPNSAAGAPT